MSILRVSFLHDRPVAAHNEGVGISRVSDVCSHAWSAISLRRARMLNPVIAEARHPRKIKLRELQPETPLATRQRAESSFVDTAHARKTASCTTSSASSPTSRATTAVTRGRAAATSSANTLAMPSSCTSGCARGATRLGHEGHEIRGHRLRRAASSIDDAGGTAGD
jgi:hypothetical protein